ncbi:MAG: hypothetical protein IPP15_07445 [Saprospiraceae bacterium]|uniref:Uncharacterized protein n=1 Tax=Candidatus Opimibacter skivensis TaxID=2982028 RepID=A0A9D7SU89_9BACT|nr:hypothetical protein [Candidatus Opimibacter skivensis]
MDKKNKINQTFKHGPKDPPEVIPQVDPGEPFNPNEQPDINPDEQPQINPDENPFIAPPEEFPFPGESKTMY